MKYELYTINGERTGKIIEAEQAPTLAANKGYWAECIEPEPVQEVVSNWLYPERPFRITVPITILFSSPTWIALWGYCHAAEIPSILKNGNRVIYLESILPTHEQFI